MLVEQLDSSQAQLMQYLQNIIVPMLQKLGFAKDLWNSFSNLQGVYTLPFYRTALSFLFSVGLVYLMYRAFDSVCIHKPNTSRPANSERYLICKGKRAESDDIRQYMFELNTRLNQVGQGL